MALTSIHNSGCLKLGLSLRFLLEVFRVITSIPWGVPFIPIWLRMGKERWTGFEKQWGLENIGQGQGASEREDSRLF